MNRALERLAEAQRESDAELARGIIRCHECGELDASKSRTCQGCRADYRASEGLPRYEAVFCSDCGGGFGPGDHGFSHCGSHLGAQEVED